MNQNAFSLGLTYLVPAFLSLSAMTGSAGAVTLDGGGITIKPTLSTVQFFGAMASDGGVVTVNEIGSTPAPPKIARICSTLQCLRLALNPDPRRACNLLLRSL